MKYPSIFFSLLWLTNTAVCFAQTAVKNHTEKDKRPNILFVIADDQSFPHASAYGYEAAVTPNFDRLAREGALFMNAFAASPGCSPSRAALLTGLNCWQLKEAGTHASSFPAEFRVFPDLLEEAGYAAGLTGKGWGPGDYKISGRTRNPAGSDFQQQKNESPEGISKINYAANFQEFYKQKENHRPFVFWLGTQEPHRPYKKGIGAENGLDASKVTVPDFLPDVPEVRNDMLDYLYEIQWFDKHLGEVLDFLDKQGELDNTFIVVTADNGMSFPRAKANVYEYGIHVPLVIRWDSQIKPGSIIGNVVSLNDLFATFLEIGKAAHPPYDTESKSLVPLLKSTASGKEYTHRKAVFASRERHSSSRYHNLGYPQRAIRTKDFLYIRNYKPERWPAGDPREIGKDGQLLPSNQAFFDIDEAAGNIVIREYKDPAINPYFHWATDKRPSEELYDIKSDPACLHNLAADPDYAEELARLGKSLTAYLRTTHDPRETANDDIFETYPRLNGSIRNFPEPE